MSTEVVTLARRARPCMRCLFIMAVWDGRGEPPGCMEFSVNPGRFKCQQCNIDKATCIAPQGSMVMMAEQLERSTTGVAVAGVTRESLRSIIVHICRYYGESSSTNPTAHAALVIQGATASTTAPGATGQGTTASTTASTTAPGASGQGTTASTTAPGASGQAAAQASTSTTSANSPSAVVTPKSSRDKTGAGVTKGTPKGKGKAKGAAASARLAKRAGVATSSRSSSPASVAQRRAGTSDP